MRLAVIGGTAFIGRHFVTEALEAGHEVTVFHRGQTNPGLFDGAREVLGDRDHPEELARLEGTFDAVIDTCAYVPRQVHQVADALGERAGAYLLVSSVSVYTPTDADLTDEDGPCGSAADLADPSTEVIDDHTYGPLKVLCEQAARARFERCTVVRPTYVVGPHDHSDRFTYWVRRIAAGGPVLAAEPADGPIQVIDVRDLAAFMLTLVESNTTGTFNGAGPASAVTWRDVFASIAAEVGGPGHEMVWVPAEWLTQAGVTVEVDLPMWASAQEASMLRADLTRATAAGLRLRPLADTIADLRRFDLERGLPALVTGLDDSTHAELLTRWA